MNNIRIILYQVASTTDRFSAFINTESLLANGEGRTSFATDIHGAACRSRQAISAEHQQVCVILSIRVGLSTHQLEE